MADPRPTVRRITMLTNWAGSALRHSPDAPDVHISPADPADLSFESFDAKQKWHFLTLIQGASSGPPSDALDFFLETSLQMRDVLAQHLAERSTQDSHCRGVSAGRPHSGSAGPQLHQGGIGLGSPIPAKT
jgi:hypothetical protein